MSLKVLSKEATPSPGAYSLREFPCKRRKMVLTLMAAAELLRQRTSKHSSSKILIQKKDTILSVPIC